MNTLGSDVHKPGDTNVLSDGLLLFGDASDFCDLDDALGEAHFVR